MEQKDIDYWVEIYQRILGLRPKSFYQNFSTKSSGDDKINFLEMRIKELKKFKKKNITDIAFSGGKLFKVNTALKIFKETLIKLKENG